MNTTLSRCLVLSLIVILLLCTRHNTNAPDLVRIPMPPAVNDPAFRVTGMRSWYLVDNPVAKGYDTIVLGMASPLSIGGVRALIDNHAVDIVATGGDTLSLKIALSSFSPDTHRIVLARPGRDTGFYTAAFVLSHPLFVVVSNDWDAPDNSGDGSSDSSLVYQEELHLRHPGLQITHFVGPYTFTSALPFMTEARKRYLVDWHLRMEATWGDEIGLHIHGYCEFVDVAGIECRLSPTFCEGRAADTTGYFVPLRAYSYGETRRMLASADSVFRANGFLSPVSFRAGGWTAGMHTLQALNDAGFVADGSGCNWSRVGPYFLSACGPTDEYAYMQSMWAGISDTSQPYHPMVGGETLKILEVPDNGVLVDYVSDVDMIDIFGKIWQGGPLPGPRQLSIGYHPISFRRGWVDYLHTVLSHADSFSIAADNGPVMYCRMRDLARAGFSFPAR